MSGSRRAVPQRVVIEQPLQSGGKPGRVAACLLDRVSVVGKPAGGGGEHRNAVDSPTSTAELAEQ